jgi:hypothetical protein
LLFSSDLLQQSPFGAETLAVVNAAAASDVTAIQGAAVSRHRWARLWRPHRAIVSGPHNRGDRHQDEAEARKSECDDQGVLDV